MTMTFLSVPQPVAARLLRLVSGLLLYGFSCAMVQRSAVGAFPWDVLHQGIARHVPLSVGVVSIAVGALVLACWIPLRQRPGIGTVANIVLVGVAMDAGLWLLPHVDGLPGRWALAIGGIVLNGYATVLYIRAGLGPGPRDGLMTGLVARTGWSIRLTKFGIEASVVGLGFVLGGTVGLGTLAYALAIGPLVQAFARGRTLS